MALYKLNVSLSLNGDRVEKGTEIELSDDQVAHLDPADLTRVSDIVVPDEDVTVSDFTIEEMSHAQLKARAAELGLKVSGSVADLRERITLHLEGNPTEGPAPEGEGAEVTTEGPAPEGEITND